MTLYAAATQSHSGAEVEVATWPGKVLLIVNVASQCGFTPQYAGLQALHARFQARGLTVLGFPCDQFGHQEPGTDADIQSFCTTRFAVTFPVFHKISVNGADADPIFTFLKSQKGGLLGSAIKWNFTKFLVDRKGHVSGRYPPTTKPEALVPDIEAALAAA